jgi:hypothetical protein
MKRDAPSVDFAQEMSLNAGFVLDLGGIHEGCWTATYSSRVEVDEQGVDIPLQRRPGCGFNLQLRNLKE